MEQYYQDYIIRDWQESERLIAASIIEQVLAEYGLPWQPEEADQDVIEIEKYYLEKQGEFWVVETQSKIVGTSAYYPISRGNKSVEIRKMYLLPEARGKGLGKYLLKQLEITIQEKGFKEIWLETASVLKEAVQLYERNGYLPASGVETKRCDRVYVKKI
jgi:putative acetyltransferase